MIQTPFFFIDKLRYMDHEFDKLRCMNHESPPSSFILLLFVIFLVGKLHIHPMDLKSITLSSNQLLWKKKMSIELKLIAPYYIIMERCELSYSSMLQFKTKKPRHLFRPFTRFQRIIEVMNWQLFVSRTNQVVSSVPIFYHQAASTIGYRKSIVKRR